MWLGQGLARTTEGVNIGGYLHCTPSLAHHHRVVAGQAGERGPEWERRPGQIGFSGRGAHIVARCPHCAWERRKCRRRPNPAHHEAGGFCGSGGAQRRPPGGTRRTVDLESVKKMTPDWEWTTAIYRRKQREFVDQLEPCCSDRGWGAPMSKFNSNLKRYRLPKNHKCERCVLPSGTIEEGLHMAARMHPGRRARLILSEYNRLRELAPSLCPHNLRKLLKESTGWLKLGGPFIYKEWRLLTYWETFSGYVAPVDLNTLRGGVDDWLTITKHNGERIDEAQYVQDILDETVRFMSEEWTMPDKLPTVEQWVASGVWMRGKAGTGRKHHDPDRGKGEAYTEVQGS
ncbi:unnamed protein product [Arctia plantaginis]|uniref:Uncharacterized protein n=1 Tax=Arctia plantaginis TaxID=874455 RepID=A0A8S1AAK5_ARCPL|nr:unnamed protein product [Arctia plantaginis]